MFYKIKPLRKLAAFLCTDNSDDVVGRFEAKKRKSLRCGMYIDGVSEGYLLSIPTLRFYCELGFF